MAWGKKREVPPEGGEARRLWDEAMALLTSVLVRKGIVRLPRAQAEAALLDAVGRMGDATVPPGRFVADYRAIVGTGGRRAAVARSSTSPRSWARWAIPARRPIARPRARC